MDIFTKLEAARRNSSNTFFQSKSGTAIEVLYMEQGGYSVFFYDKDGDRIDERHISPKQFDCYIYRLPEIY